MKVKIAPSILSARFERLGEEVKAVEAGGADQIHVDVMDGHFVPNLSMGPIVVEALRRTTSLPLDVHLMISEPERYLEPFAKAGAHHLTFHVEAAKDPAALAAWLRARRIGAGLAVNPDTPFEDAEPHLKHFDLILIMTVRPGFGGQSFLPECLEKVRRARRAAPAADVEVDGGIDQETAAAAAEAGANVFVAGSSIFRANDAGGAVRALRKAAARVSP